jgi:inorganic triphosphatase YgiF
MSPASETEIKLRLDAKAQAKLIAFASRFPAKPTARLRSTYFDDRKRRLARNGLELRVRKDGERNIQTIKSGGSVERGEWETEIGDDNPSLDAALATPAKRIFKKTRKLEPIFDVDVERRAWTVERGDAHIEMSMDSGEIVADGERQPVGEAEFELKRGSGPALHALVREAIESCDAPPSFVTKGLRGRRLSEGMAQCPDKNIVLRLAPDATVAEAFTKIVSACLGQASVNEELLRADPSNIEAVHEMRVAIRRLRAAFSLFGPALEDNESKRIKGELKWLSDALGKARDLDVFTKGPLGLLCSRHPDVEGVEDLRGKFESMRNEAHDRLAEAVHSLRFRQLLLDLVNFSVLGGSALPGAEGQCFCEFGAKEFERRLDKIVKKKSGRSISGPDELKRHRVRIKMKKLRYVIEFARPLASGKSYAGIVGALKDAQDSLGAIHDRVAAEQMLSRLLAKHPEATLAFAANIVRDELAAPEGHMERALEAFATLREAPRFWRKFA